MLGRRTDSGSRTLAKPLRQTAKAHAAELTLRQMDESLARGEADSGGRNKNKKRQAAHLLPDTPGMSTLDSSPQHGRRHEVITIRFSREELKEEDRRIADVLRVRMGLESQLKILKEYASDRIDEIQKYSTRLLEVNEKYLQLLELRSGAFNAEPADGSDSGFPDQAYVPQHPPYAYEGSSSGVPRYPPQKRRNASMRVTASDDDDDNDDHAMCKKDHGISSDEPLDPEIVAALQTAEENDEFEYV